MATNKKLTEEQEKEIQILLANNEMLENSKKDAETRGKKNSVKQIERAQEDVIKQINSIDPSALNKRKASSTIFDDTDISMFEMLKANEEDNRINTVSEENDSKKIDTDDEEQVMSQSETVDSEKTNFNDVDPSLQYDVIQLPSNGQCYKSKIDRVPVAYLTAYDENIITSPNLYKDGLVIDFLLKNKIVNKDINVDDLVSGDADAIILFLRATSYGPDFPIVVQDPETGEQIETSVDLTTLKPKEFKLKGDENGHFEFVTPLRKDTIKFRYLTRGQERKLKQVTELEGYGTKSHMLDRERESLLGALSNDKVLNESERKSIRAAINTMKNWSKRLNDLNDSEYTKIMTNNMQLQVVAVNGNYDREYVRKYVNAMPARDSLALRKYINNNMPGIDFNIEIQRPESLGGGSFKTFLNWDDSVFLNISDV